MPSTLPSQQQSQQPGVESVMIPQPAFEASWYKGSGKLLNKVALITGGDSGIGRSVSVLYAREGCDIAIVYLNEHQDAQETKRQVEQEGRSCLLITGDVSQSEFCIDAVSAVVEKFGRLDIVVNNAAIQFPKQGLEEITDEQLDRTFKTNIYAYFYISRAALRYLSSGSCIINTTSVTAYRGSEHLIDYSSTKAAIVGFTRSLSLALAQKQIRVNGVAPGPIWTPLIPATFDAKHVSSFGADVPLGRPGQPEEVAPAFVFLASQDSSYMTGQILHPNGGEVING